MTALAGCLVVHWLLARFLPSPWWVPNITLVGLMLTIAKHPERWLVLAWVAGVFTTLWTVRASGGILFSYFVIGGVIQIMAKRWDLDDVRIQPWLVGGLTLLFTFFLIWLEAIQAWPILGPALCHALATCAVLPFVRRLVAAAS